MTPVKKERSEEIGISLNSVQDSDTPLSCGRMCLLIHHDFTHHLSTPTMAELITNLALVHFHFRTQTPTSYLPITNHLSYEYALPS
jgi:hypothetical protein